MSENPDVPNHSLQRDQKETAHIHVHELEVDCNKCFKLKSDILHNHEATV